MELINANGLGAKCFFAPALTMYSIVFQAVGFPIFGNPLNNMATVAHCWNN